VTTISEEKNFSASVCEKLEDQKAAARRLLKRGRYAVEDCIDETAHEIKCYPLGSVAVAFAGGVALGVLTARLGRK
jgi:ElaB/YqjD/DUF883 family membrane-anchored ribosome-binding protein